MINRSEIKHQARLSMKSAKPSVYMVAFVMLVLSNVFTLLDFKVQLGMSFAEYYDLILAGVAVEPEPGMMAALISLALSLVSVVLGFGYNYYALRVSRGLRAGVGEIFDAFGLFLKIIGLSIISGIFIGLWTLLFVIPGIVAAYRYSMAVYILMDNPELSVMECIARSKELTHGYKFELFMLDLSFIGWRILTVIPFVSIFVEPYYRISIANYYNALIGWSGVQAEPAVEYDYREPWEK